ncbi:AfsR/SARP family transcriptional regulator [Asanoa iriomotensis]|uniref:AfsR/SARP family transcriptional regulator n=1 Tax=Asanoa iriomotensis TaxID=234613 RepID=UPI00194074C4|nr:BTAD domain-containing putative transcriptional regulator [Asanoa iriomotensis]
MEFSVLGQLEASVDGHPVNLGGARQRVVLAGLLLNLGRAVSVAELTELVWGDNPPSSARSQLQMAVHQLRQIFGEHGQQDLLRTDAAGYRLLVDARRLDLARFEAAIGRARKFAGSGESVSAALELRTALALWRDRPLRELANDLLTRQTEWLCELRLAAAEEFFELETEAGHDRDVIPELVDYVGEHPLRERLVAALVKALGRTGRQAEALALYQRTVVALREELGVDPGPELRLGHLQLLRGDLAVAVAVDDAAPTPVRGPASPPRSLPRSTRLLGRDEDLGKALRAVRAAGPAPRVVMIAGMPGVGKSAFAVTLARRLADDYPDGHLFVHLRGHGQGTPVDPVEALGVLFDQLGVAPQQVPASLEGRKALWRRLMAGRRSIVVLDDATTTAQIEPLLPDDGGPLVVVTSRAAIGVLDGAWPVTLDVLSPADAVAVLRDVVGDRVAGEPAAAGEVAELCGRLPLALRLAAHRLLHRPQWTVADMVRQLRAAEPTPIRLTVEGHSVAAAFEVSYRQLDEPQRHLFRLLGLHPAVPFEAWAAAALAGVPIAEARDILDGLVDVHLVQAVTATRYQLHDLVRAYAVSRVTEVEQPPAVVRMLDYYLYTATVADEPRGLRPMRAVEVPAGALVRPLEPGPAEVAWSRYEWPTIVALTDLAHGMGLLRHAALLPLAAWQAATNDGHSAVMVRLCRQGLDAAAELGDEAATARLHHYVAGNYQRLGQPAESVTHLELAAAHHRRVGDLPSVVHAQLNLSVVKRDDGRLVEALADVRIAVTLAEQIGDAQALATARRLHGVAASRAGDHETALAQLRRSVAWNYRHGAPCGLELALGSLARAHLLAGHFRLAALLLRRTVPVLEQAGRPGDAAEDLSALARALLGLDRPLEALDSLTRAQQHLAALADPYFEPDVLNSLGATLTRLGRTGEAVAAHERALASARLTHQRYEQARAHAGLGSAHADADAARLARETALEMFRAMGIAPVTAETLAGPGPGAVAVHGPETGETRRL